VWMGNDNYESTKRMTGGSLPAQLWGQIMTFAHQGIELKPLIGAAPNAPPPRPQAMVAATPAQAIARPVLLTKNAASILVRIEKAMDDARSALPPPTLTTIDGSPPPQRKAETVGGPGGSFTAASATEASPAVQGN